MPESEDLKAKLKNIVKKTEASNDANDTVEFESETLEDGINKACTHFNVTRDKIKYEILEEKKATIFKKKTYMIKAWVKESEEDQETEIKKQAEIEEEKNVDVNGKHDIKITRNGIFLKITPPKNNGKPVGWEQVAELLFHKRITDYDSSFVKKLISEQKDEYVKIGEWEPNTDYDAKLELSITEDGMQSYILISPPLFNGRIIEKDEVYEIMEQNKVSKGVMNEKIDEVFEKKLFKKNILIAKGKAPVNGKDATIEFKFKINPLEEIEFVEDERGRVHYNELNLVQNVVTDQVLAVKVPPTKGTNGYKVTGDEIEAENGKDIPLPLGKNTKPSDDNMSVLAAQQGQAVYTAGLINVEPIYTVEGDVGVKTGNIVFLGTVIVNGNVDDGYSIKASQNVEIMGSVGKAVIDAEGNIIIRGGLQGKEEGYVHAGQSIFAKFVNSSRIDVGGDLIVLDGILHSKITAGGRVICNGKKGKIVGGRILACKEINAKEIGSYGANTETKLESGTDPRAKNKLRELEEEKIQKTDTLKKLSTNLETLRKAKENHGSLPPEKEVLLDRMVKAQLQYRTQLKEIDEEVAELRKYLNEIITIGKISAKGSVYPGVEITIKNANMKVKNDYKFVTFINDSGTIKPVAYQEISNLKEIANQFKTGTEKESKKMNLSV